MTEVPLREYFEALLEEHRKAIATADEEREKAAQALRDNLREQIRTGDIALERHIEAQIESVKLALAAQEKFANEVQRASKEAVEKAFIATEKMAEKHNDLIRLGERDKEKYASRADLVYIREVINKLEEKVDRTDTLLNEKVGRAEYQKAEDAWIDLQKVGDSRLVALEALAQQQRAVTSSLREHKTDAGVTLGQVFATVTVLLTVAAILVGAFT